MGLSGSNPELSAYGALVVVAAAIAATASAVVVFALMRQPAAEESIAARTLVQSVDQASPTGRAQFATQTQTQAEHAADASISAASESGHASAHPRTPAAVTLAEAPGMMADAPPAREASEISASPVREAEPSLKPPSKKPRLTSRDERPIKTASSGRIRWHGGAETDQRRRSPSTGNTAHDSVVRHDNSNVVHHDKSVVGRTIGVTGDIVAATQRAILAVAAIPSWIGSIGREGQSPRQAANAAAGRELRSCNKISMARRSSASGQISPPIATTSIICTLGTSVMVLAGTAGARAMMTDATGDGSGQVRGRHRLETTAVAPD